MSMPALRGAPEAAASGACAAAGSTAWLGLSAASVSAVLACSWAATEAAPVHTASRAAMTTHRRLADLPVG
jgi:hypothetical protein